MKYLWKHHPELFEKFIAGYIWKLFKPVYDENKDGRIDLDGKQCNY